MSDVLPEGFFWDPELRFSPDPDELTKLIWPRFLIDESDIPDTTIQFQVSGDVLVEKFPIWGIRRAHDRKLAAFANGILIQADTKSDVLPNDGWRFAMRAFASGSAPNSLCLWSANVHPEFRDHGLARVLLESGKELARERGLAQVIGPVRPSHKHLQPSFSMQEYASYRTANGEIFDPWLRNHAKLGARILNVCTESVEVRASVAKWREWLGREFSASGAYEFAQGLAPLQVDLSTGIGLYREPNIWVRYSL